VDVNRRVASEQAENRDITERLRQLELINRANESTVQQLLEKLDYCEFQV